MIKHLLPFSSNQYVVKLKLIAAISAFDPMMMLLTKELSPVAIDKISTRQVLWLYNPYSSDIEVKLVSHDANLSIYSDKIFIKSHDHSAAFVEFAPFYAGMYDVSRLFGN